MPNIKVVDLNKDPMWANKFEHYRATEIPKTNIRAENYNQKRFPINKQIATFCIYDADTDDIIAFNSVFKPVHWPETVARIFNRSYYDPAYRRSSLRKSHEPGWGQKYSYDLMIQACKDNGIKVATVTRENTGKINSINSMHKSLLHADTNWKLLDDYYLGYDAPKNQSCWHRMAYLELEPCDDISKIPSISTQEYKKRFFHANT